MEHSQQPGARTRVGYMDFLRAIGILFMVLGHNGTGETINKWIHVFHMPMFFVISGYFYRQQSFGSLLKTRGRTLLLPYVCVGLLHIAVDAVLVRHAFDPHAFYLLFWENTAGTGVPIAGALWFLTAMFFSEVLFWGVQHLPVRETWKTAVSVLVSLAGIAAAHLPFRLPLALDAGMVGVGFYEAGRLLKGKGRRCLELSPALSVIALIAFSALSLVNGYVNMRKGDYGIIPLFYLNALGMTVSFWNLSRLFYSLTERKGLRLRAVKIMESVGQDSIIYLCFNQLALLIASRLITLVWHAPGGIWAMAQKAVVFLIAFALLFALHQGIIHSRLRILVGKK